MVLPSERVTSHSSLVPQGSVGTEPQAARAAGEVLEDLSCVLGKNANSVLYSTVWEVFPRSLPQHMYTQILSTPLLHNAALVFGVCTTFSPRPHACWGTSSKVWEKQLCEHPHLATPLLLDQSSCPHANASLLGGRIY